MTDSILVVDDEPAVRRTVVEWLRDALSLVRIYEAQDAESALRQAEQNPIDLAILDWNLGTGENGLQLLEDLHLFLPDLVAILITGYAGQATPLAALRLGVRDYFDKNQDFSRVALCAAVRKQLERLRPLKRERRIHAGLEEFRKRVAEATLSISTAMAMEQGDPYREALVAVLEALRRSIPAQAAALLVRRFGHDGESNEWVLAPSSAHSNQDAVAYSDSFAATIACQLPVCVQFSLADGTTSLHDFEKPHRQLLGTAWVLDDETTAILELLDSAEAPDSPPFTPTAIRRLEELRPILEITLRALYSQRVGKFLLNSALQQALAMSQELGSEKTMSAGGVGVHSSLPEVALAQKIGAVGRRFGPGALEFCLTVVDRLEQLLTAQNGLTP